MITKAIHEDHGLHLKTNPSWAMANGDTIIPREDVEALRCLLMEDLAAELELVHGSATALGAALTARSIRLECALRDAIREVERRNYDRTSDARIATWTKILEEKSWP